MILWTTHRFIRYSLRLFVSVLFANVNASLGITLLHSNHIAPAVLPKKIHLCSSPHFTPPLLLGELQLRATASKNIHYHGIGHERLIFTFCKRRMKFFFLSGKHTRDMRGEEGEGGGLYSPPIRNQHPASSLRQRCKKRSNRTKNFNLNYFRPLQSAHSRF